jgi:phosphomannomutase
VERFRMSIFKAYDIRGIYPKEINEDIIYKIGRAYADILKEELRKEDIKIVVGRDMRLSSPQLTKKLIEGITEQGVDVVDIGLSSTPTFYFAVAYYGYDGGMQVSASHNPKQYNGVKIVKTKAYPVGYDTGINEIEKRVNENNFKQSDKKGNVERKEDVVDDEVNYSLKFADINKIKPFKVVADAANAMGAHYLEKLFEKLPCELIKMNFELDGTFPVHEADPYKEENIKDLKKKVVEEKADLGIATDGDGDRIFFVDDKGELAEPGIVRGLLSKIFLKEEPGATICYDIRPGKITEDMILEYKGKPSVTKVGHSLIKAQAIKENAIFAGESSGHFFVRMEHGLFEVPMIITLKLLEDISLENKKFSEILKPLKRYYHSGEINSEVDDKEGKMKELAEKYKDAKNISWLDGVTIEYDDFWFNVRPSNTESLLRLNLEAKSKEIMKQKKDEVLKIIRS